MIVSMKKVAVIARSIDASQTVRDLRSLGLLHVENQKPPQGKDINALQEELNLINSCLSLFSKTEATRNQNIKPEKINANWQTLASHLIDLRNRLEQLELFSQKLKASISEWQNWGDFEPQKIRELCEKGIFISFYEVPLKKIADFPKEAVVKTIFTSAGISHVIVLSQKPIEAPFKKVLPLQQSLSHMQKRLAEEIKLAHSLKGEIAQAFCFYGDFINIQQELEKELELKQAINGMAEQGALSYIMGYVPIDQTAKLQQEAQIKKWGIVINEPADEDNVPVLLKNPRFIALISPIFKFLEILPGYKELDISLPFLIFFSIFFGILIGDAGYGLVYFLITFLFQQKARKKNLETGSFYLFYILSFCAIVWGVLTATFFGHEWLMKSGFKPLVPALTNDKSLQRLCFLIGAIHLSVAHGWRAILKAPSLSALSDVGWLCILWAAFFIARVLILGDSFPFFAKWLIIGGVMLVILFTNPQKNILKTIGEGLGTLALSLMNSFTDVVSYIRLFAVGIAGVAIADAFNAMAQMVGNGNIFTLLCAALIALIGNTLAIVLGPVSVLVHGVRLNVLEFSGHANISWSGAAYKPLKE